MRVEKLKDKIIIHGTEDFVVKQILECGQIFRFKIEGNVAHVYSKNKHARLTSFEDRVEIVTSDPDYFYNFFDLSTDYGKIKAQLMKDDFLRDAVKFGHGIRILNNDAYEMIVSFIISANNNIQRISKSIEYLCEHFGKNMGEYFAFPTLSELKRATVEDFTRAGLGYRAPQLFETLRMLDLKVVQNLKNLTTNEQQNYLISLKGVGEKVANCIMLFGLQNREVFPVDTWINKVYNRLTNTVTTDRKKIARELTDKYKNLSGYAQQYFFYYFRDNKLN